MHNDYSKDVDPVCGMHVDSETTTFHHEHAGEVYHFCTSVCRDEFIQHPDRFVIAEDDAAERHSEGEAGVRRQSVRARPAPSRGTSHPV